MAEIVETEAPSAPAEVSPEVMEEAPPEIPEATEPEQPQSETPPGTPAPKKRGRPAGSRNKVKVERTPAPPPEEVPITALAESITPTVPTPAFKQINFGDQMRDRLRTLHQRESQRRVNMLQRFMRT